MYWCVISYTGVSLHITVWCSLRKTLVTNYIYWHQVQISFQRDATLSRLLSFVSRWKLLLSVASRWKLICTRLVMHGTISVKNILASLAPYTGVLLLILVSVNIPVGHFIYWSVTLFTSMSHHILMCHSVF
jgi:hypothetical protein